MGDGKQSIWKQEITFRRKPKEHAVPPPAPQPARPESVAELLRPAVPVAGDGPAAEPLVRAPEPEPGPEEAAPAASSPVEEASPAPPGPPAATPVSAPRAEPSQAAAPPGAAPTSGARVAPPPLAPPPASPAGPKPEETAVLDLEPPWKGKEERERQKKLPRRERRRLAEEAKAERKRAEKARKQAAKRRRKADRGVKRHKRVVGLKVGTSQLAAARIVNNGRPRVVRLAREPLERGIVVGGELREPDELAKALKSFFRKHKLPRSGIRLGLANSRIGVRIFELAGIEDPKQLDNAIRFRAQETLPIPLEEAVLDYRILDETVSEEGVTTRRILLVVAHRDLIERYVTACRKAGLKLIGIDLEAFALLRALGGPAAQATAADDAGVVIVSIGHERSIVAVSTGEICEFTRVLEWGGSAFDVAVARALDVTPSEAEPLRRGLSLAEEGEAPGLDAKRAEQARQAMRAELQSFARDLVASLRFYQEQPGSLGIGEIVLTGGGSECGGLAAELERLIGVGVRVGNPLERVKAPRKLRKRAERVGSLAAAIGLGIET